MKKTKLIMGVLALAGSLCCLADARADGHWMQFISSGSVWSQNVDLPACTVTQFASYTGYNSNTPTGGVGSTGWVEDVNSGTFYIASAWSYNGNWLAILQGCGTSGPGKVYNYGPLGQYITTSGFTVTGAVEAGTYWVYLHVDGYGYSAIAAVW